MFPSMFVCLVLYQFAVEPLNGLDLIVYFFGFHWINIKLRSIRDRKVKVCFMCISK